MNSTQINAIAKNNLSWRETAYVLLVSFIGNLKKYFGLLLAIVSLGPAIVVKCRVCFFHSNNCNITDTSAKNKKSITQSEYTLFRGLPAPS